MPAEARCQANRGINAVGFRKPTKYCDSFRFLKLFCVHFSWDGTLKSWLMRAGFQPGATDRQNRVDKRQRELEAEIRSLKKQLAEKDEVIDVLKKSVGIFSKL